MGVEPYLVASTVEGILAQRLIRRLCKACKQPYMPQPGDLPDDFPAGEVTTLYKAGACRTCREAGYTGRAGIYELLITDNETRRLCTSGASTGTIRDHALKSGMLTLRQSGYKRVLAGDTTLEEVQRITRGDIG
jgi:general secretion pathway protein E/type IV pilus assembly protein PilB